MTATDDFPPLPNQTANKPLDLSVLARAAHRSDGASETTEPPRKRDTPPASARATGTRGKPRTRVPPKSETPSSPRTFIPDDSDEIRDYRPGILVKPLRDLYVTIGTVVLPFNQTVGTSFIQNAEQCAKALDNAAKADKQIRKVLMLLVQGSVWGEVLIAHMPIMMALAVTMVPSVRATMNSVQSDGGSTETVNPVSNGYVR